MIYPYPATAILASDGTGTARLTPPSGFGVGFGEAFGGWVTTVDAVITTPGPSTAALMELPVFAELQLV